MLLSLHIENIALIQRADIEFSGGFTSLTGETGAGKSILIDSIYFLSGKRFSGGSRTADELIRTGEDECRVTGTFVGIPGSAEELLRENGLDDALEDGTLILSRRLSRSGKGECRINGTVVPVSVFRKLAGDLVTIHGQNDSLSLLDPAEHLLILDSPPDVKLSALIAAKKEEYAGLFERYSEKRRELERILESEKDASRALALLKEEIGEISRAKIKKGEEDGLFAKRSKLRNAEKIASSLKTVVKALGGTEKQRGAAELSEIAASRAASAAEFMPDIKEQAERLESISLELSEICGDFRELFGEFEEDPTEALNRVEARLDVIYRLKMKYGAQSEEELLERLSKAKKEYADLSGESGAAEKLKEELDGLYGSCASCAAELTELRIRAKALLEKAVNERLSYLDMKKTRFEVMISPLDTICENGAETAQFMISPNAGESMKPLANIASGGELSRIMLSLLTASGVSRNAGTMIFDEIDTGISGSTSRKIGLCMRALGNDRQILCVTHSAQVAASSENQFRISKREEGGRTYTAVTPLSGEERQREIARILSGLDVTDAALRGAKELLDADTIKKDIKAAGMETASAGK